MLAIITAALSMFAAPASASIVLTAQPGMEGQQGVKDVKKQHFHPTVQQAAEQSQHDLASSCKTAHARNRNTVVIYCGKNILTDCATGSSV
jgi:hypothetical protein